MKETRTIEAARAITKKAIAAASIAMPPMRSPQFARSLQVRPLPLIGRGT
jgi:hypothetical protein